MDKLDHFLKIILVLFKTFTYAIFSKLDLQIISGKSKQKYYQKGVA